MFVMELLLGEIKIRLHPLSQSPKFKFSIKNFKFALKVEAIFSTKADIYSIMYLSERSLIYVNSYISLRE